MLIGLLASIEPAAATEGSNQILQIAGQFGIKPYLLLAQIINFSLVAFILYRFVIKPIQTSLDTRAKTIDEGLKRAEEAEEALKKAQADALSVLVEARRQAQGTLEEATRQAAAFEAKRRCETQAETATMLESARRTMALEQEQALIKAQDQLAGLVVTLAEKSLGETLTPEQKARFAQKSAEAFKQ